MAETVSLSRRAFIVGSAAAVGGLALGFHLPLAPRLARAAGTAGPVEVNA